MNKMLNFCFIYSITKSFVDFNGVVPEKFDVVNLSHQVQVEYGNVGVDFKFVSREGFGWMNASFEMGLTYLSVHLRRALGTLTDPDFLFEKMIEKEDARLSVTEQYEAERVRRMSKLAARKITDNGGAEAVVTKINPEDIIRQSINPPKSPEILDKFFSDDAGEDTEEEDPKISSLPNYSFGETLTVPPRAD